MHFIFHSFVQTIYSKKQTNMTILIVFIWFFMENHKIINKVIVFLFKRCMIMYIIYSDKKGAFYGVYYQQIDGD